MSGPADEVIEVTADDAGPMDHVAPVAGPELREIDWMAILNNMGERDRAKASKRMWGAHPNVRRARRDRVRVWLAVLLIVATIADGGIALGLRINNTISWPELRDWLTLALIPLTPGIAVALAFWYPTKEID
jgi:hypothetical protein